MIAVRTRRAALAVVSLVLGHAAQGGLLDSPPPRFGTVDGKVIFRMGPIHFQPGRTDTVITCTNVGEVEAKVAVEVFDEGDHVVGNSAAAAVPASGASITFVTSADASRAHWVVVEGLAPLDHGKARVSATTANLTCSAYHQIREPDGSVREQPLELIKKVSQPSAPAR